MEPTEDIAIAVIPKDEEFWDVFLINMKDVSITNVLVNSRGYGEIDGKPVETNTFRFFYERVSPNSSIKIEPIQKDLFGIANEFFEIHFMNILIYFHKSNLTLRFLLDNHGNICVDGFENGINQNDSNDDIINSAFQGVFFGIHKRSEKVLPQPLV